MAASRPEPGPLTYTSTSFKPCSIAAFAALSAADWAANGVDLRDPLKPTAPELAQEMVLPCKSVMVMWVLLKVDLIWATPCWIFLRSRRLGRADLLRATKTFPPYLLTFCVLRRLCVWDLYVYGHYFLSFDRAPVILCGDGDRDSSRSPLDA